MCSCASTADRCFSGRRDTLTSCFLVLICTFFLLCALVFNITHPGRRSTLTCRGLAFFSARLPPPSGEETKMKMKKYSKHCRPDNDDHDDQIVVRYWCADQMMVQKALSAKSLSDAQGATILTGWIKVLLL